MTGTDREGGPARLAVVVLAHRDPANLARLVGALTCPDIAVFVHLDARADRAAFERALGGLRVHWVEPRRRVTWAAFSQVEATLTAMEQALASVDGSCSHVVLLSGADHVLVPPEDVVRFLAERAERQFIRRFDLLASGDRKQVRRVRAWHFRELADRNTWQRYPLFAVERLLGRRRQLRGVTIACGSQWIALTRECARYCLDRAAADRRLSRYFRWTFAPDEMFFHTIVENSPFAASAGPVEPYTVPPGVDQHHLFNNLHVLPRPQLIETREHAMAVLRDRGDLLFTRKVDSEHSRPALEVLGAALSTSGAPRQEADLDQLDASEAIGTRRGDAGDTVNGCADEVR